MSDTTSVSPDRDAVAGDDEIRRELEHSRALVALLQEAQRLGHEDLDSDAAALRFLRLVRRLLAADRVAMLHLVHQQGGLGIREATTVPSFVPPQVLVPRDALAASLLVDGQGPADGGLRQAIRAVDPESEELLWVGDEERQTVLMAAWSGAEPERPGVPRGTNGTLALGRQALDRYLDALAWRHRVHASTESENRLRHLLDGLGDAAYRADASGTFAYMNQAGQEILGLPVEKIVGSRFLDFIDPRDREYAGAMHSRSLAGESIQAQVTLVNGRVCECRNEPLLGPDGAVVGILGTARDVTSRCHAEAAYRSLVDYSLQGLVIFQGGGIEFANPAFEEMVGYTRDELRAMDTVTMERLVHVDDRDLVWGRFQRRQAGQDPPRQYGFRLLRKDGTVVWVDMFANRVEYMGRPAIQAALVDVTERRRRAREQEAMYGLVTAVRTAPTRGDMLRVILDTVMDLLDADGALLAMVDREGADEGLLLELGRGVWSEATGDRLEAGGSLSEIVIRDGVPLLSNDIRSDPRFARPDMLGVTGAVLGVPLAAEEITVGVLWVGRAGAFDDDDLKLLVALGDIAAVAIHRVTLVDDLQLSCRRLEEAWESTLAGWSRALELRDPQTDGHTQRVAEMAVSLGRRLGLGRDELAALRRGALTHDLGKMGIPDEILLKPGPLDPAEWEVMRRHPELGRHLLEGIDHLEGALDIVTCHHERWDGTGYPRGLSGEEIPLLARVFAVVDVWDALRSDRPYRPAWSRQRALDHLRSESGRQFDPDVVRAVCEMLEADG